MIDFLEVCDRHNILIVAEELGTICGFYSYMFGQPAIHINVNLPKNEQKIAIRYLLIHGFLINPNEMKFLRCEQLEHYANAENPLCI